MVNNMMTETNKKNSDNKSEKHGVGIKILTLISSLAMIIYIVWRLVFTIPDYREFGWVAFIAGILLFIAESLSLVEVLLNYKDLKNYSIPEMPVVSDDFFPDVDVLIATHNEEVELLYKTAYACTRMRYPDTKRVHIYLCDDTARDEVRELADSLGVGYFGMKENKHMKAGNLNNALAKTDSPLVVTLDADMIPNSEFLLETVPYFALPKYKKDENGNWVNKSEEEIDEKEKIGFVQTPQTFYNADLFQYNLYSEDRIPNEQDYFFRYVNSGKNKSNSPIYAGSNTVISREALEEVGGIVTGTITEDFETGLRIEMLGYTCLATDKPLVKGLAPISIKALIKQRERWARGCIYSLRRIHLVLNPKIKLKYKISYGACRIYWGTFTRRLIFILAPLLYLLLKIPVVVCDIKGLLMVWLPANILHSISLKKVSGNIRNTRWSNTIDTILFPHMLLPIWSEVFFIKKQEFAVTNKSRLNKEEDQKYMAIPHAVLFVLSAIAFVIGIKMIMVEKSAGTLIVLYWLVINMFSLAMAIFFMVGRRNERNTERFFVSLDADIEYNQNIYRGEVVDISEGGFAFEMDDSIYLPHGKDTDITDYVISNSEYEAKIKGHVVSVRKNNSNNKWRYGVQLDILDEDNKGDYMQLIYDRTHTLPKTLSNKTGYFSDIEGNIRNRVTKRKQSKRELPRIIINKEVETDKGYNVTLVDYNYEFAKLNRADNGVIEDKIILFPGTEYEIKCEKTSRDDSLFMVVNKEDLYDNNAFKLKLKELEA